MGLLDDSLLSMRQVCIAPLNRRFVPQGHLREGKCHLSLGNAVAAIRCFQKVLELEPSNRDAHKEVGIQILHFFFFFVPGNQMPSVLIVSKVLIHVSSLSE